MTEAIQPDYSNSLFDENVDELYARTTASPTLPIPSNSDALNRLAHRAPQFMQSTAFDDTNDNNSNINSNNNSSSSAMQIMSSMGYQQGQGLGRSGQGISDPLQLRASTNRAGLGSDRFEQDENGVDGGGEEDGEEQEAINPYTLPRNFKPQRHPLNPAWLSHPVKQSATWMFSQSSTLLPEEVDEGDGSGDNFPKYAKLVTTKADEEGEDVRHDLNQLTPYCSETLVRELMAAKSQFDRVESRLFTRARALANPYEKVASSIFQNRAAVKMANLDKVCELTQNLPVNGEDKGILYFADVCAGPGGFTEYMYYRFKDTGCKGWGITIKGNLDFKLKRFNPESPHDNFDAHYGRDGSGDLTQSENIRSFVEEIDRGTDDRGVALVLADGGFSVNGKENQQEYLTRQLVMCQFLTGLMALRPGGTFMCKVFDLFTHFSIDLLYIMFRNFKQVSIVKPLTSRPANSERYIVCKGLKQRKAPICDFLFQVNDMLTQQQKKQDGNSNSDNFSGSTEEIVRLCDPDIIRRDTEFTDYVSSMNMLLGTKQLEHLNMIRIFLENSSLEISRHQNDLSRACLDEWNLPPEKERGARGGRGRGRGRGRGGGQVHYHRGMDNNINNNNNNNRGRGRGGYLGGFNGSNRALPAGTPMHTPGVAAYSTSVPQDPFLQPMQPMQVQPQQQQPMQQQVVTPTPFSPAPWDKPSTPGVPNTTSMFPQTPGTVPFQPQTPGMFSRPTVSHASSTAERTRDLKKSKEEQQQEILGRHEADSSRKRPSSAVHGESHPWSSNKIQKTTQSNDHSGIEDLEKLYRGGGSY